MEDARSGFIESLCHHACYPPRGRHMDHDAVTVLTRIRGLSWWGCSLRCLPPAVNLQCPYCCAHASRTIRHALPYAF